MPITGYHGSHSLHERRHRIVWPIHLDLMRCRVLGLGLPVMFELSLQSYPSIEYLADRASEGDPARIHPFLADFTKDRRASSDSNDVDLGAAALHLAIRCAACEYAHWILHPFSGVTIEPR